MILMFMWWWLKTILLRGPAQPRSPCELPAADHPHRPGSHQQSCCPLSNFQKLNFVTHIAQISYLKNMRSPSKTQPITMKELDRTRIQRAESSPKTKRSWRTQRARRAQRALSTECLCPHSWYSYFRNTTQIPSLWFSLIEIPTTHPLSLPRNTFL